MEGLYRLLAWLALVTPRGPALWVTQHVLGTRIAAGVVSHLPKEALASFAGKLPPAFNADVAQHLPVRTREALLETLPPEMLMAISAELIRKGDYRTAASFGALAGVKVLEAGIKTTLGDLR